jgi:hypothetical protein
MRVIKSLCCVAAMTLLVASGAHADEWNKKTYLTFSGPVQIPGATLPAGTYLFQLADPDNSRHVVMVASQDGTHVYGMFITIPNDRIETPDENVVMFGEAPAGAPQAVEAWWYPGERIGEEFVYPKNQATAIARANHREVLATDTDMNAKSSDSDRMASLRGSKVGHVDENGHMKEQTNAKATTTAPATAATPTQAPGNMTSNNPTNPSTTTASVNNGHRSAKSNTAAAATTTAPANTVDGRTTSKGAKSTTAVGTSGQANTTTANNTTRRTTLPRTASSLELFELLSGLSFAGAFALRRLRTSEAR